MADSTHLPDQEAGRALQPPGKLRPWLWAGGLLLLWLLSWQVIERFPPNPYFRYDLGEADAYPSSDAMNDFLNAMALSTGDGFVNWRVLTRYSTYKPGWVLILAGVGSLCDWDTGRMQRLLTFASSLFVPLLFLLLWRMQQRRRLGLVVAGVGTLIVLFRFSAVARSYFNTMMTEPPTILFSIGFALLAVNLLRSQQWTIWQGLALGLCAAILLMIRGQPKYGIALVLLLVILPAMIIHWRRRWPAVAAMALGAALILAPYWIRTSIHLGQPFTGTCFTSLRAVMQYSPVGMSNGGAELSPTEKISETAAINTLQLRADSAVRGQIAEPLVLLQSTLDNLSWHVTKTLFVPRDMEFRKLNKKRRESATTRTVLMFLVCYSAILLSFQVGPAGLVPLLYVFGYYLPNVLFDFHWERFAVPIEWIGPAYAVLLVGSFFVPYRNWRVPRMFHARRRLKLAHRRGIRFAARPSKAFGRSRMMPMAALFAATAAWTIIAVAALLNLDNSPGRDFPPVNEILSTRETQFILAENAISLTSENMEQIKAALNTGKDQPLARIRHVLLPVFLPPALEAADFGGREVRPPFTPATRLVLARTWKHHGEGGDEIIYVPRRFPVDYGISDFRHGDWYLLVSVPYDSKTMMEIPLPISR